MKNKNKGYHLRDRRIYPKNNSTGEVQFSGLKIPKPFTRGNLVVIRNLIFHIAFTIYFCNECIRK
jgi:hypothetical protein